MKLELKHLAPYLPYRLKYYPSKESDLFHDLYADHTPYSSWNYKLALEEKDEYALKISNSYLTQKEPFFSYEDGELFLGQFNSSLGFDVDDVYLSEVKPILRPLSNLTRKELELEGFDSHIDYLTYENQGVDWTLKAPYIMLEYLFTKHYDVFGLIEKGLAIDINTLNK